VETGFQGKETENKARWGRIFDWYATEEPSGPERCRRATQLYVFYPQ